MADRIDERMIHLTVAEAGDVWRRRQRDGAEVREPPDPDPDVPGSLHRAVSVAILAVATDDALWVEIDDTAERIIEMVRKADAAKAKR